MCLTPTRDAYLEIASTVKKHCDIILCTTTGGKLGETVERRVRVASTLKPELALAQRRLLKLRSLPDRRQNQGLQNSIGRKTISPAPMISFSPTPSKRCGNSWKLLRRPATKPEFEVYDMGMINNLAFLIKKGIVKEPVYLQFVMGHPRRHSGNPGKSGLPCLIPQKNNLATSSFRSVPPAICRFRCAPNR